MKLHFAIFQYGRASLILLFRYDTYCMRKAKIVHRARPTCTTRVLNKYKKAKNSTKPPNTFSEVNKCIAGRAIFIARFVNLFPCDYINKSLVVRRNKGEQAKKMAFFPAPKRWVYLYNAFNSNRPTPALRGASGQDEYISPGWTPGVGFTVKKYRNIISEIYTLSVERIRVFPQTKFS